MTESAGPGPADQPPTGDSEIGTETSAPAGSAPAGSEPGASEPAGSVPGASEPGASEPADSVPGASEPGPSAPPDGPDGAGGGRGRRLRRARPGQIGGVAAGLGAYAGIDPVLLRIGFAILAVLSGLGVFVYVGLWLLLPPDDDDPRPLVLTSDVAALVAGFVTLAVGSIVVSTGAVIDGTLFFPLALVGIGFWVLNQRRHPEASTIPFAPPPPPGPIFPPAPPPPGPRTPPPPFTPGAPAPAPGPGTPPPPPASRPDPGFATGSATVHGRPVPPATGGGEGPPAPFAARSGGERPWPAAASDPLVGPGRHGPPPYPGPSGAVGGGRGPGRPAPPGTSWAQVRPEPEPVPSPEPGPPLVSITTAVAVVVIGALLVVRNLGGAEVSAGMTLGAVLAVFGVGLVVSAFTRRSFALWLLSTVSALLLAVAPLLDGAVQGGVGSRQIVVDEAGESLQDSYDLGAGNLELDLRRLTLGENRVIEVAVGAGYAEILLPPDLPVRVEAASTFGYVDVLDVPEEGALNELLVVDEPAEAQPGTLTIRASVTFGYVEVRRG